jgi:hypothetical protein
VNVKLFLKLFSGVKILPGFDAAAYPVIRRGHVSQLAAIVVHLGHAVEIPDRTPTRPPSCVPSLHGHYPLLRYYGRSDSRHPSAQIIGPTRPTSTGGSP